MVGAHQEDSKAKGVNGLQGDNSLSNAGAAYVYVLSGNAWGQQAYLKASAPDADDHFGAALAVSGDTIVVGAPDEDSNATGVNGNHYNDAAQDAGAVYIFTRTGTTWTQQAYIKASNTQAGDHFGRSVSISGDTLLVGAPDEDSNATGINGNQSDNAALNAGAVYVFTRSGTTWSQQAYIKASNTDSNDTFGSSTAISGNSIVVGAPIEASNATGINGNQNDNSIYAAGAAYAFIRNGSIWSQQAYIKPSNFSDTDILFGSSVAISGSTIVVGAPFFPNLDFPHGTTYVFIRSAGIWSQQALFTSGGEHEAFGGSVGISGDTVIVGAVGDGFLYPDSGAAYTFVRDSSNAWTKRAYIKASNAAEDDLFGVAVAISGNILAVGAFQEDSNATGVNGNQLNNSMKSAGAAYVFNRIPAVYTSERTSASPTTANTVDFKVTFSDPSTCVDASDFKVTASSQLQGASVLGVSGGPSVYTVTVSTGSGNGTIRLDVVDDDSILNEKNVPLGGFGVNNGNFTNGQFYILRPLTKVFRSQAGQDGWVLESGENTGVGGTMDSSGSLIVGDDDANRQYRSVVSFDTSSLPDTAIIVSGLFKLRKEAVIGTDPFTTHGAFRVALCKEFFGATNQLALDDFNWNKTQCRSEYYINDGVSIVQGNIEPPGIVNRFGLTQFRLRFFSDDNHDASADYISFYSGDASTTSYQPALVVEYYVR